MDGVQVRRCLNHGAITALHINASPYNAGEKLRRTAALRWRLGLLYTDWPAKLAERLFPKRSVIKGNKRSEEAARKRAFEAKKKRQQCMKLLYKRIAEHLEEYRKGFEFFDEKTGGCSIC
jgi:hypothetical protein